MNRFEKLRHNGHRIPYTLETATEGEEILYVAHLHWLTALWIKIIAICLAASVAWIEGNWGAYTLTVACCLFIWAILYHRLSEIVLTNHRFVVRLGVFSNKIQEMATNHLDEIIIEQSLLGRIFDYGHITIHCKGLSEVRIKYLSHPLELHRAIEQSHVPERLKEYPPAA